MKKQLLFKSLIFISIAFLLLIVGSCKKNNPVTPAPGPVQTTPATPVSLGLYEIDSSVYKDFFIPVPTIGNVTIDDYLIFDTGSGGLVLDAQGILPASMITSTGFNFPGDSVVVNGITITTQTSTITYGDDCSTANDTVYGNLAYANVTVGDQNGNLTIKRLPFFLYYKATTGTGSVYPAHEFDIFGVNEEYDFTFSNNVNVTSPFSYFNPGTGLTRGFKSAPLGPPYIYDSNAGANYAPGVITVGLTSSDVSSSSGFVTTQLKNYTGYGYPPIIPATISYNNNKTFAANILFDSGTTGYSYVEDPTTTDTARTTLAQNSQLSVATTSGFNYSYTVTASDNQTYIENPTTSCSTVSIISDEYFLNNEYMLNYVTHSLGLKNN